MENKRILIVDDVVDNLEIIIKYIEEDREPYELLQALNGEVAFEIAVAEIPDLIITDWEMPVMDGIELIKKVKQDERTAEIPVIMCTGAMLNSEHLKIALQAGAVDYVRKPIDKVELLARIQATLRLADSFSEIKKLNNAKDKIFSIIAHDLRGPVGNIKSFSELILYQLSDYEVDKIAEMIESISRQSASAFYILDNLFAWAKSQQKQLIFEPIEQPLAKAVNCNIDLLTASAERKGIDLQNNIDEEIEAYFDEALVSTILRNLIANAIKFTEQGGVVTLSATEEPDFVKVSVTDNGIGISEDRAKRIFDKTTYDTTFGTNAEKGSGLGLKLCKEFVEKNGGTIWIDKESDKGTTFAFTLPATQE